MVDSFELDEKRSAGKVLEIRSPFLPKQPVVYDDTPGPDPMLEWKQASIHQARDLAEQVVSQLDPARVETVCQLETARREANQALNDARARLATLSAGMPADADLDQLTQFEGQRAALVRHIPTLEARAKAANDALGVAIQETRSDLETLAYNTTFKVAQRELHAIETQIEGLQQRAANLERALHNARALVLTWGSEAYHPPVQAAPAAAPAPEPPATPKRKRLFS
jgi:hypothetical protein